MIEINIVRNYIVEIFANVKKVLKNNLFSICMRFTNKKE